MQWLRPVGLLLLILFDVGCVQSRMVTITAKPADAVIKIDGRNVGRSPIAHKFVFATGTEIHYVGATRLGYEDRYETVTLNSAKSVLNLDLKPRSKEVFFRVEPGPAILSIDGKPVSAQPVSAWSTTLNLSVDAKNEWIKHTVTAERPNYEPATATVSWPDRDQTYVLNLQPKRKNLTITSSPNGAEVFVDEEAIGRTPVSVTDRPFPADLVTNEFVKRTIRVAKPGYDAVSREISWDDGKSDYHFDLEPRSKSVRIVSDPPGAKITLEGQQLPTDAGGTAAIDLRFLPVNDTGELRSFSGVATKAREGSDEWEPTNFTIAWDEGKTTYHIALKEILTRDVPLLTAVWTHNGAWEVSPRVLSTIGMKNITDGDGRPKATLLTRLAKGTSIDTLVVSPDGQRLLFTSLSGKDRSDFRSQMYVVRTDGEAGADLFSDGKSLDLTPAYSPAGDQIVFASNRAGARMSIWQMSADGSRGIEQRTTGDTNDLWPMIDSDPRPRLYYQSMIDNRTEPRLFATTLGNMFRTDLQLTGMQPRVNPKNDAIVFTSIDDKTGKRDIFRVAVGGGTPQNMTNTPDIDEFDAAWSPDGNRIAFSSDRGVDADQRHNLDVWIMDVNRPEQMTQVTTNGSQDDSPAWDPTGASIYFRSNRGGDWGIWKIAVK